jgi:hypothetical protein
LQNPPGMWRSRLIFGAAAALALTLAHARTARAGALAEVVHGLHEAAGDDGHHESGGSGKDDHDSSSSSSSSSSSDDGHGSGGGGSGCCSIEPESNLGIVYEPPGTGAGVSTELYFGGQAVADSDGAVTLEARALYDNFGLGVRGTSWFEQEDAIKNTYVHLDLWWLGAFWRADHDERSSVWVELGLTGLSDPAGLDMNGLGAGVHFAHALAGATAFVGGARYAFFSHDVHEGELYAGVQASILQIAYRVVYFDVGPPLHGPEVGVALTF